MGEVFTGTDNISLSSLSLSSLEDSSVFRATEVLEINDVFSPKTHT